MPSSESDESRSEVFLTTIPAGTKRKRNPDDGPGKRAWKINGGISAPLARGRPGDSDEPSGRGGGRGDTNYRYNEGAVSVPDVTVDEDGDSRAHMRRPSSPLGVAGVGVDAKQPKVKFDYRSYDPFRTKKRRTTTPEEAAVLETAFLDCKNPDIATRTALAEKLNMKLESVGVWFQNRRAKERTRISMSDGKDPSPPAQRVPVTTFHAQKHPRPKNRSDGIKYSLVEEDTTMPVQPVKSGRRPRRSKSSQPETPPLSPGATSVPAQTGGLESGVVEALAHQDRASRKRESIEDESVAAEEQPRREIQRALESMRDSMPLSADHTAFESRVSQNGMMGFLRHHAAAAESTPEDARYMSSTAFERDTPPPTTSLAPPGSPRLAVSSAVKFSSSNGLVNGGPGGYSYPMQMQESSAFSMNDTSSIASGYLSGLSEQQRHYPPNLHKQVDTQDSRGGAHYVMPNAQNLAHHPPSSSLAAAVDPMPYYRTTGPTVVNSSEVSSQYHPEQMFHVGSSPVPSSQNHTPHAHADLQRSPGYLYRQLPPPSGAQPYTTQAEHIVPYQGYGTHDTRGMHQAQLSGEQGYVQQIQYHSSAAQNNTSFVHERSLPPDVDLEMHCDSITALAYVAEKSAQAESEQDLHMRLQTPDRLGTLAATANGLHPSARVGVSPALVQAAAEVERLSSSLSNREIEIQAQSVIRPTTPELPLINPNTEIGRILQEEHAAVSGVASAAEGSVDRDHSNLDDLALFSAFIVASPMRLAGSSGDPTPFASTRRSSFLPVESVVAEHTRTAPPLTSRAHSPIRRDEYRDGRQSPGSLGQNRHLDAAADSWTPERGSIPGPASLQRILNNSYRGVTSPTVDSMAESSSEEISNVLEKWRHTSTPVASPGSARMAGRVLMPLNERFREQGISIDERTHGVGTHLPLRTS
ncbi:hypothetical protein M427DRAFT_133278 [Gonapodya prolifera JEL478]|uniref:Homeobox domain-containing protein n=1 Tax=Gonapodya prolifera (strain JEL478) TaxID=1344416 RepID=A0A139AMN8_GONPJ|nr:hypothetical protein M427DRAFT_133278 [Gonapodya prolifera JEL478]|eukprot:KXS17793.1 hypothetical protein M427DRAFT_133278 [Gonapodya prolifera JEL478]